MLIRLRKSWSTMSRAEKRVAVCKDALQQIQMGIAVPLQGVYIKVGKNSGGLSKDFLSPEVSIQKCIPNMTCGVCAKGSLLLAHVDIANELKGNRYSLESMNSDTIVKQLKNTFSKHILNMIETAFEERVIGSIDYLENIEIVQGIFHPQEYRTPNKKALSCINFGKKYTSAKRRLIAILENVIENKGKFKP